MSSSDISSIHTRLDQLEKKIELIASRMNIPLNEQNRESSSASRATSNQPAGPQYVPPVQTSVAPGTILPRTVSSRQSRSNPSAGQLLGYAGLACLFFAVILLVRMSIESGWLTPERQLILASVFGASLIALPFVRTFEFKSYISQLPALGVVVFHLAIYAATFYHEILSADTAIILVSAVGMLSLVLLEKFDYDGYALISIIGTYAGALFLKGGFPSNLTFFAFLVIWNAVYSAYAIYTGKRKMILITSYLAIGLVSLKVIAMPTIEVEYIKVASAQMIQFLMFLGAVALFSKLKSRPLTREEAWSFFPLLLFFYGLEYHLLDKIDPNYATAFAIILSVVLWLAYQWSRKSANQEALESADVTYTTVAGILSHAFYLVLFQTEAKVLTPFAIFLIFFFWRDKIFSEQRYRGVLGILGLVLLYSFGLLMTHSVDSNAIFYVSVGVIYGLLTLFIAKPTSVQLEKAKMTSENVTMAILLFAHSQLMLAIYRMKELFLDRSMVAPLWIGYAFAILLFALKGKDKRLAQSSFPIITLSLIRFMLVDFSRLESGSRVLALLVMGALIFAGGYLYKKTV